MFGIVLANMESLSEEERDRYRSVYCGICHSLKARHGQISRMCVNYDMVLLALLRESLLEGGETVSSARCLAHPAKVHRYAQGAQIDYAADASIALAYHKCLDDWDDDKSKTARAYSAALTRSYKRVKTQHPRMCDVLECELQAIRDMEAGCKTAGAAESSKDDLIATADGVAKRFGYTLAYVFADGCGRWSDDMAQFGAQIGRFIYFMDAALDRVEDEKSGSYNPFNLCNATDEDVELLMSNLLGQATDVFERLPLERDLNLMRSVLYAGVWQRLRAQYQESHGKRNE